MTTIGSGLGATLGVAEESTWNTYVAPTRWLPFESEALDYKPAIIQAMPLWGQLYPPTKGHVATTHSIDGDIKFYGTDRQMGVLFKHMLGAAPVITGTGPYTQVYQPGDDRTMGLTLQVGRPEVSGTVDAYSYTGCKVIDWEMTIDVDKFLELTLTVDGASASTAQAYAAPSYVTANYMHFAEATLTAGGTVSTSGGVCSVSGGTVIATAKNVSIKGSDKLKIDRFYLGAAGTKAEPIANGFRQITGTVEVEYENLTDVYNAFVAQTALALELKFVVTGGTSLDIILPNIYWDSKGNPNATGPEVLGTKVTFAAGTYDNTNPACQITYVTNDSTA
jgi:hypothetical protein